MQVWGSLCLGAERFAQVTDRVSNYTESVRVSKPAWLARQRGEREHLPRDPAATRRNLSADAFQARTSTPCLLPGYSSCSPAPVSPHGSKELPKPALSRRDAVP